MVAALRDLIAADAVPDAGSQALASRLDAELAKKRPDLTDILLAAARLRGDGATLPKSLVAATVRAGCARLAKDYPGASIELRIPPWAAAQIGFEQGPRHTRGTPPNVVEMAGAVFIDLATGLLDWETALPQLNVSGVHACQAAKAFPLL